MKNPFAASLIALLIFVSAPAAEDGFQRLFNGRDLQGWDADPALWRVVDGVIVGVSEPGKPATNSFLIWNGTLRDFELRVTIRVIGDNNSGIQYRSKLVDADKFVVGGYQADFEAGKTYSGILYEERGRGILAERGQRTVITDEGGKTKVTVVGKLADSKELQASIHDEQWNDYLIVADGNHLMHFINGRMTVDVVDQQSAKAAKEGILALQIHAGPPMVVQFRDGRTWLGPFALAPAPRLF